MLRMDAAAILDLLGEVFPQALQERFEIRELDEEHLQLHQRVEDRHLRPGGTVSGPTLMTLADSATFFFLLAHLGPMAMAVTTNLNIHFLRRPVGPELFAEARLLKLGKRLAVAEVKILQGNTEPREGPRELVAQASVSYSLPPSPGSRA